MVELLWVNGGPIVKMHGVQKRLFIEAGKYQNEHKPGCRSLADSDEKTRSKNLGAAL